MKDNNSVKMMIAVIAGLILPIVLGVALSLFGMQPTFSFMADGSGLTSLLTSGAGIGVYLITAALFILAGFLPAILSGSSEESYEEDNANDERESGIVKWFNPNKGFGFITREGGDDIFVHFRSIRGRGHRSLRQGQKVRFRTVEGDKGLQAEDVSPVR
ncbi:Cold shock protein [Hahella chejuensis KCTC 2396]|uniref:Cold shock protein n=1 Tax=Hahella chejuensis (strain KCTC 2396) TaxID=349521 RepID=Q2SBN7_HAHCH|nr:cold-shock protein [Hahella chejuensis]ABC31937.1 Cold shock protein [Hahella chejuensis KCTC 2396]